MAASPPMELLETLGDFTSKSNWDSFFTLRGRDDSFEWYADWPSLSSPLLSELSSHPNPQILVPGCGSSRLSEHLYDAGFRSITNIDFSKVAISDMLRRNVRARPEMRWRLMDMTDMHQFAEGLFDAAIDKGGLDALMEPKLGPDLGKKYLREVKRVLKVGGKYVCYTLAESHVIGLLFSEFRFSWKTNIQVVPQKSSKKNSYQTFMVVATKEKTDLLDLISSSFDMSAIYCCPDQGRPLVLAIESENRRRNELLCGTDIIYSLEDMRLGAKGDLKTIIPGRRCQFLLGELGGSHFRYKAVLLDAQSSSDTFTYHCGVFLVPKTRAHEWLFSSEEGQWVVSESSKAARLIMVFLDSSHALANINDIQKDLSPLIKSLEPSDHDDEAAIPFLMAGDGVKERNIIAKVTSAITGAIIVEDVIYDDESGRSMKQPVIFRRLTFGRSQGLVQSEAVVISEQQSENSSGKTSKKGGSHTKSKKKGALKRTDLQTRTDVKIDHGYLASSYHRGILSGFALIVSQLESAASSERMIKTIIIGLGAGLFPMCLRSCLPFLDIEVVELDAIVFDVARNHFGFMEDAHLKVHIADGIKFIQKKSDIEHSEEDRPNILQNGLGIRGDAEKNETKILILDADSSDQSSGLACPPEVFLQESFLLTVKEYLSGGGLFVINLVSRSPAIRETVISRMKKVFSHLFYLGLEEDVNDVLFALPRESSVDVDNFQEMAVKLRDILTFTQPERKDNIIETSMKIKRLQ